MITSRRCGTSRPSTPAGGWGWEGPAGWPNILDSATVLAALASTGAAPATDETLRSGRPSLEDADEAAAPAVLGSTPIGLVLVGGPGDGCRARSFTDDGAAARELPVALTTSNASRCARLIRYPTVTGTA